MTDECELKLAATEIEDKRLLERIAWFPGVRLAVLAAYGTEDLP